MSNNQESLNDLQTENTVAKRRWEILRNFVLQRRRGRVNNSSVLEKTSFGLVSQLELGVNPTDRDFLQTKFSLNLDSFHVSSLSLRRKKEVTLNDFETAQKDKVDNTGNVCLWPSEEVLTYYCLKHKQKEWEGKRIIEIGCGLGVAGLFIASNCKNIKEIVLTDGNSSVIDNLKFNVENLKRQGIVGENVNCKQLLWQNYDKLGEQEQYDVIIAADCLFFEDYHEDLIQLLYRLSKPDSSIILFNPGRGGSCERFIEKLKRQSQYKCKHFSLKEEYDSQVFSQHLINLEKKDNYSTDSNYPLLLEVAFLK